jgi:hypothetical protein
MLLRASEYTALIEDIRTLYHADVKNAEHTIDIFLAQLWGSLSPPERVKQLEEIISILQGGEEKVEQAKASAAIGVEDLAAGVRERFLQSDWSSLPGSLEDYLHEALHDLDAAGKIRRLEGLLKHFESSLGAEAPSLEKTADTLKGKIEEPLAQLLALVDEALEESFKGMDAQAKIQALEELILYLDKGGSTLVIGNNDMFSRLVHLLLGSRVSEEDLTKKETADTLASALNAVMDSVGELIETVETKLHGKGREGSTIRTMIGVGLASKLEDKPLKEALEKIKEAFLVSHRSFREANSTSIEKILLELSPEELDKDKGSWLKVGALRKAELYDRYCEKYNAVKRWYDSGDHDVEYLREFERNCRKQFN